MNNTLQIFLIILLILILYLIFRTVKKNNLSMKHGMYFTIIFVFLLILIVFPNIIEFIANLCGFKEAPNLLFLIAIFILFYIVFRIYVSISKINERNKKIIQEVSLFKYEQENGSKK